MIRKKKEYTPFKKHFYIPFSLALVIILAGIIMTLTNQSDTGYWAGRGGHRHGFILTGPDTIILGVVVAAILLWSKKYLN